MKNRKIHITDHAYESAQVRLGIGHTYLDSIIENAVKYGVLCNDNNGFRKYHKKMNSLSSSPKTTVLFDNIIYVFHYNVLITLYRNDDKLRDKI